MEHEWSKAYNVNVYMCKNCGCYMDQNKEPTLYNHPDTGITTAAPDCPPKALVTPALYNGQILLQEIKAGRLTGKFTGLIDWHLQTGVPTMSVYNEWCKYGPVATFHHAKAINFKTGVVWYPEDITSILQLHQQWITEIEKLQQ